MGLKDDKNDFVTLSCKFTYATPSRSILLFKIYDILKFIGYIQSNICMEECANMFSLEVLITAYRD